MAAILVIPVAAVPIAAIPVPPPIVVPVSHHDIVAIVRGAVGIADRVAPVQANVEIAPAEADAVGAGGCAGGEAEEQRASPHDRRPADDSSFHLPVSPYLKPIGRCLSDR